MNSALSRSTSMLSAGAIALTLALPLPLSAQEAEAKIRPARLIEIAEIDPLTHINLPAVIEPAKEATLTLQVGGVLTELPVIEGQPVAEGDLIAQVDRTVLLNNVAQAQTQFENAELEFTRAESLLPQQAIAQSTYDQRKVQRDIAELSLQAAQKQLDDATLSAPFSGVISSLNVSQFQTVSPQTAVATLQSNDTFEAIAHLPARALQNPDQIDVQRTEIILDIAPLNPITAVFKSIDPQADPASQTFEVRFSFDAPSDFLVLPGMTGEVQADLLYTGNAASNFNVQVPLAAVQSAAGQTFVWIVDTDTMTVSRRDITVAEAIGASLPVVEGLEAGDTIVGAGASYLHEGQQIRRYED
ncbi:efflux RND transporter periplasmic adaptor subunit [Halocynthiibacter styelae]|uniref:Efflux RND transporter periplasmic adaptor subunit n=1 Tax=Halocynthiibacter styelae TaxID=2761955 RepID=A0A8J7IIF6_9RHOB|nr:efflux RND transporter periplasmic adaptor subunit [Paenihalocynthiibacter styelae]MBI1493148.1 efflux RND transporter periplasmic adaptor subunit [Paenihalocynthiibacter styelae]